MKKRFENILIRNWKKKGIFILTCTAVLSITLGMLAGCSVTKENTEKENIENEDTANEDMEKVDAISNFLQAHMKERLIYMKEQER